MSNGTKIRKFEFDCITDLSQEPFFSEKIKPKLKLGLEGYNMAFFTYGQTGSGKTFTLFGSEK